MLCGAIWWHDRFLVSITPEVLHGGAWHVRVEQPPRRRMGRGEFFVRPQLATGPRGEDKVGEGRRGGFWMWAWRASSACRWDRIGWATVDEQWDESVEWEDTIDLQHRSPGLEIYIDYSWKISFSLKEYIFSFHILFCLQVKSYS
jgi:hypothetical protein